jgi:hypothetical protein
VTGGGHACCSKRESTPWLTSRASGSRKKEAQGFNIRSHEVASSRVAEEVKPSLAFASQNLVKGGPVDSTVQLANLRVARETSI